MEPFLEGTVEGAVEGRLGVPGVDGPLLSGGVLFDLTAELLALEKTLMIESFKW